MANSFEGEGSTSEQLIQQCVYIHLLHIRNIATPGKSPESINRPTARILNTFEVGRTHSKPFLGVQEVSTLHRYSGFWSRLIHFLIRISHDNNLPTLRKQLLPSGSAVSYMLQQIVDTALELQVANTMNLSFKNCMRRLPSIEDDHKASEYSEESEQESIRLRQHTVSLKKAICRLSIHLTTFNYDRDPFQAPIVAYCAFCTLTSENAWIAAQDYSPFLSGMIHCMQLWLLNHCLEEYCQMQAAFEASSSIQNYVQQECNRFLVNISPCPIAELSYWRLLSRTASNDIVHHPVTTLNDDCTVINHLHIELRLQDWRSALKQLLEKATDILESSLLFDQGEAPRFPVEVLKDNPGDRWPARCFLDDPRNDLHAVQDWLFHRLQVAPELRAQFFKPNAQISDEPSVLEPRPVAISDYLHANQLFLRLLAPLIYMGSGLPPRRKELAGISWCNQETARNVYLYHGFVAITTGYHKSQWRIGTRPVARFLPQAVGELLVRYLIYVPPFVRFLNHRMQRQNDRSSLFCKADSVWSADRLGDCIKRQTRAMLGFTISTRQWRHIAIALDRRTLLGVGCRTYEISTTWGQKVTKADASDSDLDIHDDHPFDDLNAAPEARIHHLQAAYTTGTNTAVYGNDLSLHSGLTDSLLAAFFKVSQQWHQLTNLPTVSASSAKRRRSGSENPGQSSKRAITGSSLVVRRTVWNWPALEKGLQQLFGPDAQVRNQLQRDALSLVARSRPETLVVMPTGSGKTILYVVPTLLPGAKVTVVIVPLVALKQDLLRRCAEWGLEPLCYSRTTCDEGRLHAVPSLVFVDVDSAVTQSFRAFLQRLQKTGRLDRIILEEAHLLLTASHYREQLGLLGVLRNIGSPFVFMTATLPPSAEMELKDLLHFTQLEVLRAESDRPNLQYRIQLLPNRPRDCSRADTLVAEAVTICKQDARHWLAEAGSRPMTARGICFVRTKALGSRIQSQLGCHFYHADLDHLRRDQVITAWSQGVDSPILVATAALSAGLDYPSICLILHVDAPGGLVDYAQETGRAGRDGLPAV